MPGGGAYEPEATSAPYRASAIWIASTSGMAIPGSSASKISPPAASSCSAGTFSRSDATVKSCCLSLRAAAIAALPAINVTRLE